MVKREELTCQGSQCQQGLVADIWSFPVPPSPPLCHAASPHANCTPSASRGGLDILNSVPSVGLPPSSRETYGGEDGRLSIPFVCLWSGQIGRSIFFCLKSLATGQSPGDRSNARLSGASLGSGGKGQVESGMEAARVRSLLTWALCLVAMQA